MWLMFDFSHQYFRISLVSLGFWLEMRDPRAR
jgi:hypothetical protein